MAKLKDRDIMDINKWFEDTLNRLPKVERKQKMRMRRKIRLPVNLGEADTIDDYQSVGRTNERCIHGHAVRIKRRAYPTAGKEDGSLEGIVI